MKIALIITGLGMGGAERQVCDLADQFVALGHQVLLISMTGETVNRPQSTMVEVVALNMVKTLHGFVPAYLQARKLIKRFGPDVVHSHMVHANLFARLLRLSVRLPKLICTAHSSNEGGRTRMLMYRLTDSLCDLSTNVSQEAADAFVQQGAVPASRVLAMYNGIDTSRFSYKVACRERLRRDLGLADNIPLLLAVGRLTAAKDYPNLFAAFSQLPDEWATTKLAIIGGGEEETKLKTEVVRLGLADRVVFLGLRRNVDEWMSAADLFVLSSAWEGFGLVVAEAMACERLVVATDCGGVKEVVGDTGLLIPPKNSAALAQGLIHTLRLTPDVAIKQGALARQRIVERYSLSSQAARWLALYRQ